jgi:D-3-phosphoglycerate dehydrogenase
MDKPKVLFVDSAHPSLRELLENMGYVCHQLLAESTYDDCLKIIGAYTGLIIRSRFVVDERLLDHALKLKFIGRVGAGMENINCDYASQKGVACLNAPEGNRDAVAEQAVGMLLMLFNNLIRADSEVRQGIWRREANRGLEIGGKTIGIIGYGNTGSAFARKLMGFDAQVMAYDKYKSGFGCNLVEEVDMETIFNHADVLSLHVPLSDETRHMVNHLYLERFRKPIYLINTSRGPVVDTNSLLLALDKGKVKGACLDVLEFEDTSFESIISGNWPEAFQQLIRRSNVVLSPHIAGWTHESNEKMASILAQKISDLNLL